MIKILKVTPVIIKPYCLENGLIQSCHTCELFKTTECMSPRKFCAIAYENNPNGCPKYGKRPSCPPNAPMFDEVFDLTKTIYAIFSTDENNEVAIKNLYNAVDEFKATNNNYHACLSPEALGIDFAQTLNNLEVNVEWPVKDSITRVALLGEVNHRKYISILN